jgi:hypothetical protein
MIANVENRKNFQDNDVVPDFRDSVSEGVPGFEMALTSSASRE